MLNHVCDKVSRSLLILLIVMVILRFYFIISEQVFFFFLAQSSHKSTHFQPFCKLLSFINEINNRESEGGELSLPNIQRYFVWDEDQMVKLFDSIMRQYPLPSLLIWKTKEPLRHREFIQHYIEPIDVRCLYRPTSNEKKRLVLDGQQRLQTLYIGLTGSIESKILHFDALSGLVPNNDGINYKFRFILPEKAVWPNIPFRGIIYTRKLPSEITAELVKKYDLSLSIVRTHISSNDSEMTKTRISG